MSNRSYGCRSSASRASRPLPATSARYPSFSSSRSASFWFTTLSSASRIRSGCSSPSSGSMPLAGLLARDRLRRDSPSTDASAPCSAEALIGFVDDRADPGGLPPGIGLDLAPADRRGEDDGELRRRARAGAVASVEAVHARHQHVEHRDVERRRRSSAASASSPSEDAHDRPSPKRESSSVISARFVALSSTTSTRRPANDPSRRSAVGVMSVDPGLERQVERAALARDAAALDRTRCRPSARRAAG